MFHKSAYLQSNLCNCEDTYMSEKRRSSYSFWILNWTKENSLTFHPNCCLYPISYGYRPSLAPTGGGWFSPTLKFNEGGNWDPMLLFRRWTSIKIELTHKKLDPNLTNWARFWNFKKNSVKLEKIVLGQKCLPFSQFLIFFGLVFLQTTQYW